MPPPKPFPLEDWLVVRGRCVLPLTHAARAYRVPRGIGPVTGDELPPVLSGSRWLEEKAEHEDEYAYRMRVRDTIGAAHKALVVPRGGLVDVNRRRAWSGGDVSLYREAADRLVATPRFAMGEHPRDRAGRMAPNPEMLKIMNRVVVGHHGERYKLDESPFRMPKMAPWPALKREPRERITFETPWVKLFVAAGFLVAWAAVMGGMIFGSVRPGAAMLLWAMLGMSYSIARGLTKAPVIAEEASERPLERSAAEEEDAALYEARVAAWGRLSAAERQERIDTVIAATEAASAELPGVTLGQAWEWAREAIGVPEETRYSESEIRQMIEALSERRAAAGRERSDGVPSAPAAAPSSMPAAVDVH